MNKVVVCTVFCVLLMAANGAISPSIMAKIERINKEKEGYLGIVVPNAFEMDPLLQSSSFVSDPSLPYLDFAGRRFRFGKVEGKKVIIVMTGLAMLNAGTTTELLLTLFKVKGVLHYGIAGNLNSNLQIGDVVVPQYWAHTGLWNWQRFGDGPNDELGLESAGDYTRSIGYIKFSDYNVKPSVKNELNNVWYQPEEIFPVYGTPEIRQHIFWIPVDHHYFSISKKLEGLRLVNCVNETCLPKSPVVARVKRGASSSVFLDNSAYGGFLNSKFNITPIDMESAGVALVCMQQNVSFIAIRSLSDLAGGGSSLSNEAQIFSSLAAQNSIIVLLKFISLLP